MISDAQFIQQSIRNQLPSCEGMRFTRDPEALQRAYASASGVAMHWLHQEQAPAPLNNWTQEAVADFDRKRINGVWPDKTLEALAQVRENGARFDFLVDMEDRRVRIVKNDNGEFFSGFFV